MKAEINITVDDYKPWVDMQWMNNTGDAGKLAMLVHLAGWAVERGLVKEGSTVNGGVYIEAVPPEPEKTPVTQSLVDLEDV